VNRDLRPEHHPHVDKVQQADSDGKLYPTAMTRRDTSPF
jgi:hypothetical protein